MQRHNLDLGYLGESIAKKYLGEKGYKILEQNCKNKYGEIDLICQVGAIHESPTLVFVEVKTRIGEQFGTPEDAINRNKIRRLIRNAQIYIARTKHNMVKYRIDAVCIVIDENKQLKRINHYENISQS